MTKGPRHRTSFLLDFQKETTQIERDENIRALPLSCQHSRYYVSVKLVFLCYSNNSEQNVNSQRDMGLIYWVGAILLERDTETCLGYFQVVRKAFQTAAQNVYFSQPSFLLTAQ